MPTLIATNPRNARSRSIGDHLPPDPASGSGPWRGATAPVRTRAERKAARMNEAPFAAVAEIKDHLAFYSDRVDAIEERASV